MDKHIIKLSSDSAIREFFKKILLLLLISSLFWLLIVVAYFEYKSKSDINRILQTEYESFMASPDALKMIHQNKVDESIRKKIEERAKKHNIQAVEIYLEHTLVFKSISQDLPEGIKKIFTSKLVVEGNSIKDALLLPSDGNIYLLALSTFDNKTIKIVKRLSSDEAKELDKDIITILFIALSSIILTTCITFPFVYKQYKKLAENEDARLQANLNMLNALGKAIAKRDTDTYEHNYRVTYYSLKIAQAYGLSKEQLQGIVKGAFLHDIGKIGISDSILLKSGKLTRDEFETIKTHVQHGEEIVSTIEWLQDAKSIIANHHEKFDGTGYPSGKRAEEIPIEARIFAVADVFDALTSRRPYKEAYDYEESMGIIQDGVGSHFDEKVVDVFVSISKETYCDINNMDKFELETVLLSNVEKIWEL